MIPLMQEVERMIAERRSFAAIEGRIEWMDCTSEVKAALWMYAWSQQTPADREQVINEALESAAQTQ